MHRRRESTAVFAPYAIVAAMTVACSHRTAPSGPITPRDAHIPSAPHGPTREIVVEVSNYLAVGWAEAPTVRIEGAPPETSATLYIPAGLPRDPAIDACWRGRSIAVGDRYRLTVRRDDRDAGPGGPYHLRIAIREPGANASWDVLACERAERDR